MNSDINKGKRPNEILFCQANERVTNSAHLLGCHSQQTNPTWMHFQHVCM